MHNGRVRCHEGNLKPGVGVGVVVVVVVETTVLLTCLDLFGLGWTCGCCFFLLSMHEERRAVVDGGGFEQRATCVDHGQSWHGSLVGSWFV